MDSLTFMENNLTFQIRKARHLIEKEVFSLVANNFEKYLVSNPTSK